MTPAVKKRSFLCNRFVQLIEEHHQQITEAFINDLLKDSDTDAYRRMDLQMIYESSDRIYRDLSKWIARDFGKDKIAERYTKIGQDRYRSGIPFYQVQKAIVLQKRHLWLFVMDKLYSDAILYLEAIELNNRISLYFDRAVFYMLKAYKSLEKRIV